MSDISAPFTITTSSTSIQLGPDRAGEATFTVFNTSGRSLVGRALIHQSTGPGWADTSWFTISGDRERALPAEGAEHFTVQIAVPPEVPPGDYLSRFDIAGVEDVNELHVAGPGISVQVLEAATEEKTRCTWCIPAAVAAIVLLIVVGVVAFLLTRGDDNGVGVVVPNVQNLTANEATDILVNACEPVPCFSVATTEEPAPSVDNGRVIETDPAAGTSAQPGSEITLVVAANEAGITIPDVRDMTQDDATSTLEAACDPRPCFNVVVVQVRDQRSTPSTVPFGAVMRTTPPGGTPVEPGSEVRIHVNTEP